MKKTSLVIMAAGIGSRFGGGIKQLEPVGPSGEIIMDYSIYDALNAGFDKVVFIIRKDLEQDFKEIIGKRIEKIAHVEYAYQELDDLPKGYTKPDDRTKPWGTGQALLCAKTVIHEPFVVINADDYYGKEGFIKIHEYLVNEMDPMSKPFDICMGGFVLGNTLSENGGVTRGVCQVDERGILKGVTETYEIRQCDDWAEGRSEEGTPVRIPLNQNVSMNMWGLSPAFLEELERGFPGFLDGLKEGDVKTEYLLPKIIDKLVQAQKAQVTVLETRDRWFGVTYKEDKPAVAAAIRNLVSEGVYPERLFDVR
ncbi:nucleotidyltransferase family protein [Lacrimispora sphenoides]|uniref:Nucleotidyl transferase n=1 Tax=Lacrimispora sphenoides JCM 1415 TaxID=1297793 RepID=A0ABY1CFB8_9FIRM|nr:sugar phosphate nucleotidyltransferase [Lacrimispora sphenoides]SET98718.1 Nucleotidyl transferase [[Clostridium] sphenoides JCM 1415]SUY52991.1 dTDP-glucose pyrophosphorylase [Lacrimispora sphenoides]